MCERVQGEMWAPSSFLLILFDGWLIISTVMHILDRHSTQRTYNETDVLTTCIHPKPPTKYQVHSSYRLEWRRIGVHPPTSTHHRAPSIMVRVSVMVKMMHQKGVWQLSSPCWSVPPLYVLKRIHGRWRNPVLFTCWPTDHKPESSSRSRTTSPDIILHTIDYVKSVVW